MVWNPLGLCQPPRRKRLIVHSPIDAFDHTERNAIRSAATAASSNKCAISTAPQPSLTHSADRRRRTGFALRVAGAAAKSGSQSSSERREALCGDGHLWGARARGLILAPPAARAEP